jgi:hypothetical protein
MRRLATALLLTTALVPAGARAAELVPAQISLVAQGAFEFSVPQSPHDPTQIAQAISP